MTDLSPAGQESAPEDEFMIELFRGVDPASICEAIDDIRRIDGIVSLEVRFTEDNQPYGIRLLFRSFIGNAKQNEAKQAVYSSLTRTLRPRAS